MRLFFSKHVSLLDIESTIMQTSQNSLGLLQKHNWLWPNDHGKLPRVRKCLARVIAGGTLLVRQVKWANQATHAKTWPTFNVKWEVVYGGGRVWGDIWTCTFKSFMSSFYRLCVCTYACVWNGHVYLLLFFLCFVGVRFSDFFLSLILLPSHPSFKVPPRWNATRTCKGWPAPASVVQYNLNLKGGNAWIPGELGIISSIKGSF